jgi:site-specific DNA-methyltransferase (adenine-specific)
MRELNYIDETIEKDENPALRIGSVGRSALSTVYLMDCIEGMKQFPDKIFDLVVVDPPYDFSCSKTSYVNKNTKFSNRFQRFGGDKDKGGFVVGGNYPNSLMKPPSKEYFNEIFRVSKNQIIWGGQTFANLLPNSMEWIFWDKRTGTSYFADGELAWTSFGGSIRMYRPNKLKSENKIHPTQKPEELYDWIFAKYTSEGNLILDTHLGSQSSRIAANKAGLDFVGFEIDREYYDNGNKRFKNFVSQGVLF